MTDAAPYDLLGPGFDRRDRVSVTRSYVICSTPRSGSTLLSEALHRTGRLGVPAEYLDITGPVPYLYERWGCAGMNGYVDTLHALRSSDDGVFGVKVHWHQLLTFANVSQGNDSEAPVDFRVLAGVVRRVAPQPAFVYVTRLDQARQAVSHYVASLTNQWIDLGDGGDEVPPYDYDGIQRMTLGIEESEASWERFFTLGGVEPLRIVYEDFVADYEGTVRRVAEHTGVDPTGFDVAAPRMRRQARPVTIEYADRFREERAQRK